MTDDPIAIGTETDFGIVEGVMFVGGERYYLLGRTPQIVVSMLPERVVRENIQSNTKEPHDR